MSVITNSIDLTFISAEGKSTTVKARIGDTVLETAEAYDLPICGTFWLVFLSFV